MSKKPGPILYRTFLYKMGEGQYTQVWIKLFGHTVLFRLLFYVDKENK